MLAVDVLNVLDVVRKVAVAMRPRLPALKQLVIVTTTVGCGCCGGIAQPVA